MFVQLTIVPKEPYHQLSILFLYSPSCTTDGLARDPMENGLRDCMCAVKGDSAYRVGLGSPVMAMCMMDSPAAVQGMELDT